MKKKIKISELKKVIKEEFMKEFGTDMEKNISDGFWGNQADNFDPSDIDSVSNIEDDNDEYSEMLEEYIGELYDIKTKIEELVEKLSYFDETNKESFSEERGKLVEVLTIITDLYNK